jgi:hypothetical protein
VKKFFVLALLVALNGCGMMGRDQKDTIILVEPGDVAEVVDDREVTIQVKYKNEKGETQTAYEKRSIAGQVVMPKSVYRKMRAGYVALYDFVNGKITEQQLREQLKEVKGGTAEADQTK